MKSLKKAVPAESTSESSNSPDGNSLQLLVPVAAPVSMGPGNEFWQNDGDKKILALLALYKSLLDNTWSPDTRAISIMKAVSLLSAHMPKIEAEAYIGEVLAIVRRSPSPFDGMF